MAYADSLIALSDPTRRSIFEALAQKPSSVADLAAQLPVSRPAVSQHLRVLSDAGLVHAKAQGTRRIYALQPAGLVDLRAYLDQFWTDALAAFAAEVDHLEGGTDERTDRKNN